jgi:DNA polymerase-3 subunit delta'
LNIQLSTSNIEPIDILQKFKSSFAGGRIGHAYLIVGDPRGAAARLAENILQLLFCSDTSARPCGKCSHCLRTAKHIHPDAIWIEPIKKSRGILVEQIEEVQRYAFQTTFEGGWKAIVLLSADRMNIEASNKLLKTLEEPPPRTIFLLLSDQPEALLPTVVSRCQRVALPDFVAESGDALQSEVLDIAVGMGSGETEDKLRKACALIDLLKKIREQVKTASGEWLIQAESYGEAGEDIEEIIEGRIEAEYRERRKRVLRLLLLWQRDLMLCASGLAESSLFFRSAAGTIHAQAAGLTKIQAMNNISIIENMYACLNQHLPETSVIERAFMQFTCPPCLPMRRLSSGCRREAGEGGT